MAITQSYVLIYDMQPTMLDLFSGIGGFSLAFEREGFKTIGFSEIDPYASAVLRKHWPDVPNYGDIRTIRKVRADVVTGGFPCQPFSFAGKRKGKEDDRYLWPEMLRVVSESGAAWVVGENVPGIINMELDRVLSDLENIGYAAWPLVIPACAVDARHRRDRVWILAHSERKRLATHLLEEGGDDCKWHSQQERWWLCKPKRLGGDMVDALPFPSDPPRSWEKAKVQPCILGGAYGIPARVDRLKCLGNSIVPQVAQVFAKAIRQFYP